jgi:cephalosporin-C deacetylase-like acetyl esterase
MPWLVDCGSLLPLWRAAACCGRTRQSQSNDWKYRVSKDDAAGYQFPVPLLDARRAIRVTRARAREWGVDPAKVGVMGSSAGGHLASMCTTLWDERFAQEGDDETGRQSCRRDFAILV